MNKRLHRAQACLLLAWIFAIIFEWFSPERGSLLLNHFIAPALFVCSGMALARRRGAWRAETLCSLFLAGWYLVTRVLNGPHYLETDYDAVWRLAVTALLAFPLGMELDAAERGRALKWLAGGTAGVLSVIAWVAVIAAVTGKPFSTPLSPLEIGINDIYTNPRRLNVLNMHPNVSAALFCLAFGMLLYLAAAAKRKGWIAPVVLCCIGLYAAVALTDSRTAMIALALELGAFLYLLGMRVERIHPRLLRAAAALCVMALVAFGAYKGFTLATDGMNGIAASLKSAPAQTETAADAQTETAEPVTVMDQRPLTKLGSFSGRTSRIYPQVIPALQERPLTLLIGNSTDQVIKAANRRLGQNVYHWHNAFLQTLMTTGLPGLLAVLALSVLLAVQALRLFLSRSAPLASQALVLPVAGVFLHAMMENLLFVNAGLPNLLFMLLAGFVFAEAHDVCGPLRKAKKQS